MAHDAPPPPRQRPHLQLVAPAANPAPPPPPQPSTSPDQRTAVVDRALRAAVARLTRGASPYAALAAGLDWAVHLAQAPGRQSELAAYAYRLGTQWALSAAGGFWGQPGLKPAPGDHRFDDADWSLAPFRVLMEAQLAREAWWREATAPLPGLERRHAARVQAAGLAALEALSPANHPLTHPGVVRTAWASGGLSLWRGAMKAWEDHAPPHPAGDGAAGAYVVGETLAATPGAVIYRNRLFELIQYKPATDLVGKSPVLIVPAWIMKYYVLDLEPQTSLIRYLVGEGHTVFCMSWRNPDAEDRDIAFDAYRTEGVMPAIAAASEICSGAPVHVAGCCLGGTIAAIAAATMAREGDPRLASLSLLAAQTDFSEAGELMTFVDESQVALLEDMMWAQGVLTGAQMAAAFDLMRPHERLWGRWLHAYALGEDEQPSALGFWNADRTRMPARMHSEYLRSLFLENRLTAGRFAVEGRVIALKDIAAPIFAVGTEHDHIAPWRSVYKAALFTESDFTFALASGGHNTGIVASPSEPRARYRINRRKPGARYCDPDCFTASATAHAGSWWPAWSAWLHSAAGRERVRPAPIGDVRSRYPVLAPAPGTYVHMR